MNLQTAEDLLTRTGVTLLLVALLALSGCSSADKAMLSMIDQVDWNAMAAEADAEGINPGMKVEAGLKYFITAGLDGVSVRGSASAKGVGNTTDGLSEEARDTILGDTPLEPGDAPVD